MAESRNAGVKSNGDDPVVVWGLPLVPDTFAQALDRIDRLVAARRPTFFITANLNYAMLTDRDERLKRLNEQAAFLLASAPVFDEGHKPTPGSALRLPSLISNKSLVSSIAFRHFYSS